MNRNLAIHVVNELICAGVEEYVLCPGARNASFIQLISSSKLKHTFGYEERSAAFYALGVARRTGKPVAVISTSGTAAGELLCAAMEGYYTSVPLILVTADRPRHYRGHNAPQSCHQVGLYTVYAETLDFEREERWSLDHWKKDKPLHLNVCFEDPARDEPPHNFVEKKILCDKSLPKGNDLELLEFLEGVQRPLVIVSTLQKKDRLNVVDFLTRLGTHVYLEGVSGIRNAEGLKSLQVIHPRLSEYDVILRIGGIPTHRIWRDLEDNGMKVLSITDNPFGGLSRASHIYTEIGPFLKGIEVPRFKSEGQAYLKKELLRIIEEEPNSEPALIHHLSKILPANSLVYLGNSLPIRTWDLAASYDHDTLEIQASRGLNGIDGQLSCFIGLSSDMRNNYGIFGDLTALYDFAAGWFLQDKSFPYAIFVINNGGGKIFDRRFTSPVFQHPHHFDFKHFAKAWNLPYQRWDTVPESLELKGLIEITPDPLSTARFWQKWEAAITELACVQ